MLVSFTDRSSEFNALVFAPRPQGAIPSGITFGMAWGDLNGDHLPDLYINNHDDQLKFLISYDPATDRFVADVFAPPYTDTHGAAWGDFNNDGLQDLFQSAGANNGRSFNDRFYSNRLYVNEDGKLVEQGAAYQIQYAPQRARQATWLDADNDGKLDVFVGAIAREDGFGPSRLLLQRQNEFVESSLNINMPLEGMDLALSGDFNGDGIVDLLLRGSFSGRNLHLVLGQGDGTFVRQTNAFPAAISGIGTLGNRGASADIVAADFDNDGDLDLWIGNSGVNADARRLDANSARLFARVDNGAPDRGFEFAASGALTFTVTNGEFAPAAFIVGAAGRVVNGRDLSLDSGDASVFGRPDTTSLTGSYTLVWRDAATGRWRVEVDTKTTRALAEMIVTASGGLSEPTLTGDLAPSIPQADRLLLNDGTGVFSDGSAAAGLLAQVFATRGLGVGDFDNDGDLDVYALNGGPAGSRPNTMWRNDGGIFTPLISTALGAGVSTGIADGVTVADFDSDGWLDLLTSNGASSRPFSAPGGYELFQNDGGSNSWLKIDLTGVVSNRDGLGATVFVTAGGVTQMRQMTGGVHGYVQDSGLLHFGLGAANMVTLIEIRWPSGLVQTLSNVGVNRILTITEGASNAAPTITALRDAQVAEGQTAQIAVTATDANGDAIALSVAVVNSATGVALNPSRYVFTDNGDGTGALTFATGGADAGVYLVTVTASDGVDASTRTASLTVTDVPTMPPNTVVARIGGTGTQFQPPRFEVIVDGVSYGERTVLNPVAVFNPANDALFTDYTFSVPGAAPRRVDIVFLNDGFSGTVNRDLVIDYIAVNGRRFETETFATSLFTNSNGPQAITGREEQYRNGTMRFDNLPVTSPVQTPPDILPIDDLTVNEGEAAAFNVRANDLNGDAISLSASVINLGTGLALAPSRFQFIDNGAGFGSFLFLPNLTEAGTYQVAVTASDGTASTVETAQITVLDVANTPLNTVVARIGGVGTQGTPPLFTITIDGQRFGPLAVTNPVAVFNPANDELFRDYTFSVAGDAPRRIDIGFVNDGIDGGVNRDLWIDYIVVNGLRFETETAAVNLFTNGEGPQTVIGREAMFRDGIMRFDNLPATSPGNVAPTIGPIDNLTINEGTAAVIGVSASDANGDAIALSAQVVNLGTGLALDPSRYSFSDAGNGTGSLRFATGFNDAGSYSVTFTAGDGALTTSRATTLTVIDVPQAEITVVRARVGGTGTVADPARFEAVIDGVSYGQFAVRNPVATFNPANDAHFSDFFFDVAGGSPRRVDLVFLNDGLSGSINRDLWIDYIEVAGRRFETETFATSLFTNDQGPQSATNREGQFRNGIMRFDDLPDL